MSKTIYKCGHDFDRRNACITCAANCEAQRDALLAAAKAASTYLGRLPQFPDRGFDVAAIRRQCDAAIAVAESKEII